jgi:hypothetical protein
VKTGDPATFLGQFRWVFAKMAFSGIESLTFFAVGVTTKILVSDPSVGWLAHPDYSEPFVFAANQTLTSKSYRVQTFGSLLSFFCQRLPFVRSV